MRNESTVRTLCTATVAAGFAILIAGQPAVADDRENIVIYRDVPAYIPYRGRPLGKASTVDPSGDELLLSVLGLDNNSAPLNDADIAGLTATPGRADVPTGNSGAGFTEYLIGHNGKNSLQTQSLAGRLGGAGGAGRALTAATGNLDVRINNALQPLSGLVNLR